MGIHSDYFKILNCYFELDKSIFSRIMNEVMSFNTKLLDDKVIDALLLLLTGKKAETKELGKIFRNE